MSAWLAVLAVLIIALAIAGASWAMIRREKTRLGFLFSTTQALLEARDLDAASVELLQRASVRFGADCAELTLLPETGSRGVFRTTVRAAEPVDVMRSSGLEDDDDGALRPPIFGVIHIAEAQADPWVTRLCGRLGVGRGLAVTLRHGSCTIGYLALGMRVTEARESRADDQSLQELANQVALTIERSRLHDGLVRLNALQSELAARAFHDPLTQLASRVIFVDRMEKALLDRDPERHVVSVISVDLEDFRRINAEHGRAVGDAILVEVARRLRECLRRSDTAARLGGDEFALLLPEVLHPREAELIAQRVVEALAAPVVTDSGPISVKASVGLACAGVADTSASTLLQQATAAATEAHDAGAESYRIHGGSTMGSADPNLAGELESALDNGELVLEYQPIVELRTGIILGAEALVRWQHPVRGLIAPLNFLPIAVEFGLIERIEEYVMRTACDQLKRWQAAFPATPELAMSINVSAGELLHGQVVDRVTRCLTRVDIDPSSVILEFTENAVLKDLHSAIITFDALQRAGVQVAIDDVGTGYTSLAYLRRLPIDILKIAQPLVAELGDPNSSGELARTVVRQGEALRLALVAEGVELPLQVKRLNELGCAMAQGYHLARPCGVDAVEALLSRGGLDPAVFRGVTPVEVASAEIAPAEVAPAPVALAKTVPAEVAPAPVALAKTVPAQIEPAKVAPTKIARAEVTPAPTDPADVALAPVTPTQVALAEATPAGAAPAERTRADVAVVKTDPAEVASAQVGPATALAEGLVSKARPATVVPVTAAAAAAEVAQPKADPAKAPGVAPAPTTAAAAEAARAKVALTKIASATAAASAKVDPAAPLAGVDLTKGATAEAVPAKVAIAKAPTNPARVNLAPANGASANGASANEASANGTMVTLLPAQAASTNASSANADAASTAPAKTAPAKVAPTNAPPAKTAPAKVASAKAPTNVALANVVPATVVPATVVLADGASANGAMATVAPALAASTHAAPAKVAPASVFQTQAAPANVPAARVAPAKRAPAKAAPEKRAPARRAPVKAAPAKRILVKPAPAKRAPMKTAPAKRAPAKRVPVKPAPAKRAPMKTAPAKRVPVKPAPAKRAPVKGSPLKAAPAKRDPTKRAPAKRAPVKRTPVKAAPAKRAPTKRAPAKRAPAKRAPAKRAPAKRSPVKAAPAKRAAAKRAPVKLTHVKAAPTKRAPAKRAPATRAPAKRAPATRAPVRTAPVKRSPVKSGPAKRAPARTAPAKRAAARSQPTRSRRVPSKGAPARNSA